MFGIRDKNSHKTTEKTEKKRGLLWYTQAKWSEKSIKTWFSVERSKEFQLCHQEFDKWVVFLEDYFDYLWLAYQETQPWKSAIRSRNNSKYLPFSS